MTHGAQNIVSEIDLEGHRSWRVAAGTQQSLNVTHIIHRTKDGRDWSVTVWSHSKLTFK